LIKKIHTIFHIIAYLLSKYTKKIMRKYLKEGKYSFGEEDVLGEGSFGKVYRGYNH
jgi:hypothetical protein